MGRHIMALLKVALLPLALCLLFCLLSNVSGKPNPGHLLIETKDEDADYNDYGNSRTVVATGHSDNGTWNFTQYKDANGKFEYCCNGQCASNLQNVHKYTCGGIIISAEGVTVTRITFRDLPRVQGPYWLSGK